MLVVGCALLAPIALAERGSHITLEEPLPQPAWELPLIANGDGTVTDSTYLGRVTYVDFWASWCAPCRAEHSTLMSIKKNGYPIIGVNYKDTSSNAAKFLTELGNPYIAIGSDVSGKTAINWGVYGIPETFLLNKENKILLRIAGPITRTIYNNQLKEYLER